MTSPTLSPEAQLEFDKRMPSMIDREWSFAYLEFLKKLASRDVPELQDVEVKGAGLVALEASREEHRIALELKEYATHELGPNISAAVGKLPAQATLDDFLDRVMPNTGRKVRRERFKTFLAHEAKESVELLIELETSRERQRIKKELKAYAIHDLGGDISAVLKKLPAGESLDDCLARLMPNTRRDARLPRFMKYLVREDEEEIEMLIELEPSREARAEEAARIRFARLADGCIPALSQYDLHESYRVWWRTQDEGNPLRKHNGTKKGDVARRYTALAELLPSRPDQSGITKKVWQAKAEKEGLYTSDRTFNRDVDLMVKTGLATKQADGRYRKPKNKSATK